MSSPAATVVPPSTASETVNSLEIIDIMAAPDVVLQPGLRGRLVNLWLARRFAGIPSTSFHK